MTVAIGTLLHAADFGALPRAMQNKSVTNQFFRGLLSRAAERHNKRMCPINSEAMTNLSISIKLQRKTFYPQVGSRDSRHECWGCAFGHG
eukprot:1251559-Amphidinium_carterae.1